MHDMHRSHVPFSTATSAQIAVLSVRRSGEAHVSTDPLITRRGTIPETGQPELQELDTEAGIRSIIRIRDDDSGRYRVAECGTSEIASGLPDGRT